MQQVSGIGAPAPWPFLGALQRARLSAPHGLCRRGLRGLRRALSALAGAARCVGCGDVLDDARRGFCGGCVVPSPPILKLQGGLWVLAGGRFEPPLRQAIHRLKYSGQPEVAEGLTNWWLTRLNRFLDAPEVARASAIPHENHGSALDLIPVPLHATRLVERGYNQSALLASQIAPWLGARVGHQLERNRQTRAQAGLGKLERAENIQGAFRASRPRRRRPVILIDDVATTGATLGAAAAALRSQDVECLGALVLAASRD